MPRLLRLLFAVLLLATPLAAEDARFLIERIDVRNLDHVSPQIVVAESRLVVPHSYTERDLREASDRINRLPFVLGADFSLEKGSVRDAYVLVVTVTEAKPFFYLTDAVAYLGRNSVTSGSNSAAVGFRWFVGRRGVIHTGLSYTDDRRPYTSDYQFAEAGYTQYDVLGTRAFATFNLRRPAETESHASILPEVVVGIPISANQTLTARYSAVSVENDNTGARRFAEQVASVRLSYNTTNHPFFPTRGVLLSVGPTAVWSDRTYDRVRVVGPDERVVEHLRSYAIEGTASRYWEIGETNAVSATLDGGIADIETRSSVAPVTNGTTSFGTVDFTFSHRLSPAAETLTEGESRLELHLRSDTKQDAYRQITGDRPAQLGLAWVKRNAWGSVRLGLGYAW